MQVTPQAIGEGLHKTQERKQGGLTLRSLMSTRLCPSMQMETGVLSGCHKGHHIAQQCPAPSNAASRFLQSIKMALSSLSYCIRLVLLEVSRATETFKCYPAWLSRAVTPATTVINKGAHQRNANSCMEFGEVWEEPFIAQGSSLRVWERHMVREGEKCVLDQLFYFRPFPNLFQIPHW